MSSNRKENELLEDVLAENADADFRGAVLSQTLHLARRKRRFQQIRQAGAVLAVVVIIALLALRRETSCKKIEPTPMPVRSYELVQTFSLPASEVVTTTALDEKYIVTSRPTVLVITTNQRDSETREASDDELLALAPRPAALVRRGPNQMELIFATPNHSPMN
jgi:hypothetical protein